jgi:hypothetical protein
MFHNECRHNQMGGCKNGVWDDESLNEVSMNIVFEISYSLDFKREGGDVWLGKVGSGL